jgi:hypothetical protein
MAQFAQALSLSGRMLTDQTGITEKFGFQAEYAPTRAAEQECFPKKKVAFQRGRPRQSSLGETAQLLVRNVTFFYVALSARRPNQ